MPEGLSKNIKYYRYPWSEVFLRRLFGGILLALGLPTAFGGLWLLVWGLCKIASLLSAWLSGQVTFEAFFSTVFPMVVTGVLVSPFLVILLGGGATELNKLPSIGVDDSGVYVQLFPIKWIRVPWVDVLDLQLAPPRVRWATDVLRLKTEPLLFGRFSFALWVGWWAGIPISPQIQGFDELLQTIKEHLAVVEQTNEGQGGQR